MKLRVQRQRNLQYPRLPFTTHERALATLDLLQREINNNIHPVLTISVGRELHRWGSIRKCHERMINAWTLH